MSKQEMPIYDLLTKMGDEMDKAEKRGVNGVEEWVEARGIDMMELLMFSKDMTLSMLGTAEPLTENAPAQIRTAFMIGYELAARSLGKDPR